MVRKPTSKSPRRSTASHHPVPDWQQTYLWQTLEKRASKSGSIHASDLLHTLGTWMTQLDAVLRHAGTSPLDFTLHNDQHAFRVAERMAKLLTPSVRKNISDYELALLLLAAYGHDIGMCPEREQVTRHHRHLFHPEASQLSDPEKKAFQEFIDNFPSRAVTLPLTISIDDLNLADELTTYYVRDRHNDWSGDYLHEHLQGQLAHLPDTVPVLSRLCKSHHQGFDDLARPEFDPILSTGPQPQLIHLRYLACLLRLSDILENDPERTPEVIFRHRSIQDRPGSLTHWLKNHHFTIDEQENQLVLHATPPSARLHHAIVQLSDWIDHELRGIAAFGEKLPVEYKVGSETIRRDWHLAPALVRRIQPQPGTYRYIDGAFRPNTQRLLQLLSNEQLYGKPIVAVRELLQNAFDAVREKIARKRLEAHITDKADRKWEALLGNQEKVTLTLRRVSETVNGQERVHHILICDDTGVGLTERLITGHLLVSGQSRRHDVLELERRCLEAGFHLGRTGQFGIGVLSYFMLAREVHLTTTRFQGCGDSEGQSWHFTTHGLSDFGELRPAKTTPFPTGGTRVEWVLRPDRIGDEQKFAEDLRQYLRNTLIRIPCQFEFRVEGFHAAMDGWQHNTGWTSTLEEWKAGVVRQWPKPEKLFDQKEFLLSTEDAASQRTKRVIYATALEQANATLRLEEIEVPLPDGLGWTRLILPYFDLPQGRSLFFPLLDEFGHTLREDLHGLHVPTFNRTAWKGMACFIERLPTPNTYEQSLQSIQIQPAGFAFELDIQQVDRETLEVSRLSLIVSSSIGDAIREALRSAAKTSADSVLNGPNPNFYGELNLMVQQRPLFLQPGSAWWVQDGGTALRPLAYPLAHMPYYSGQSHLSRSHDGKVFQQIESMINSIGRNEWKPLFPTPDRLCRRPHLLGDEALSEFIQCWELPPATRSGTIHTRFPAEWRDLAMVYNGSTLVAWQTEHPLNRLMPEDRHADFIEKYGRDLSPDWEALHSIHSPCEIARFLLGLAVHSLGIDQSSAWQHFQANHHELVSRLWHAVAEASGRPLADLVILVTREHHAVRLTPEGMLFWDLDLSDPPLLPEVTDPEFVLVETES